MAKKIRPRISHSGQRFYDKPVIIKPKQISAMVTDAYDNKFMQSVVTNEYQRVHLTWMKPGPDGKLVPK